MRDIISNSMVIRARFQPTNDKLGELVSFLSQNKCNVEDIKTIQGIDFLDRAITFSGNLDKKAGEEFAAKLGLKNVFVMNAVENLHYHGKLTVEPTCKVGGRMDLAKVYTPYVGDICKIIHADKSKVYDYTIKSNTVAVLTDGTAVLGFGNIGPEASLPVMEGKSMLFKMFGNINSFPIALNTTDVEEIVKTVKYLAPVFGGINLEDIAAPRCFEIEERLRKEVDIPVFHDDQHGTAIVVSAALKNALKIVKKDISKIKIVVLGAGAAGTAIIKMLMTIGAKNIIAFNKSGIISKNAKQADTSTALKWLEENTNPEGVVGTLDEVMNGAEVFVGVSVAGALSVENVKKMSKDAIVFALANPVPEIMPSEAKPYVRIMATGRSDFPNQINNVLAFPGIFAGALEARATDITDEMKAAAVEAIAGAVADHELNEEYVLPSVFESNVSEKVKKAVFDAAIKSGVSKLD